MNKKVLIIGAGGAMGKYLTPMLVEKGYDVTGIAKEKLESKFTNLRYLQCNFDDENIRREILQTHFDGIVDFMIYPTSALAMRLPEMLESTDHYIYLSTYRIYDNKEHPIKETSPRLLDTADDIILRNSDDYSVYKARGENMLMALPFNNWTAVRPAITYSLLRYQLVTLEANNTVGRAFAGKKVVVPEQAKNIQATMSWAGDVARMIEGLLFNEKAKREIYTVATAEHHTWGEIADYYKDICNLDAVWVDKEDYIRLYSSNRFRPNLRWQLEYDRLFDRIMDNSKILAAVGMKQSELKPLYDGLKYEISRCPKDYDWGDNYVGQRMDEYLAGTLRF